MLSNPRLVYFSRKCICHCKWKKSPDEQPGEYHSGNPVCLITSITCRGPAYLQDVRYVHSRVKRHELKTFRSLWFVPRGLRLLQLFKAGLLYYGQKPFSPNCKKKQPSCSFLRLSERNRSSTHPPAVIPPCRWK